MIGKTLATAAAVTAALALTSPVTATAAEPDLSVQSPVSQQLVRVENTPEGVAVSSPGILGGNLLQIPVHLPINVCGNTVNVVGVLNPAFGNVCINEER